MSDNNPINDRQLKQYEEQGYFTVEGLFTAQEVEGVRNEIPKIVARYPDVPTELVQIEPTVASGEKKPESFELGVRKLSRMARHNEFFRNLAFLPKMVGIAKSILGPDIVLHQGQLLMKPPHFGGEKVWHQDNAYFRLEPNHVFGFWVACDDATVENGCMHVLPSSHTRGIAEHAGAGDEYGLVTPRSLEDAVPIPLKPGDALVFHGELYHYTPPNRTDKRRRAVQYHYASSQCRQTAGHARFKIEPEVLITGQEYVETPTP